MQKIYVYENKLFKETSIDLYVKFLQGLRIKYLGAEQDCLDWIVYSPYFSVEVNSNIKSISYGFVKTDNETIYCIDQEEYNNLINLLNIKSFEWYEQVQVI
jgi:hypothetical protein